MNECPEFSLLPGEPGIAGCDAAAVRSSCRLDIYLRRCDMRVRSFVGHSHTGFSVETYFQMVHNSIDRYETSSLHTAIEMLSKKQG